MKMTEETYSKAAHEQVTNRMMENTNQHSAAQAAAEADRARECAAAREKMRRTAAARYGIRCAATAAITAAAFFAMSADLIAPVLAIPATYFGTGYFGWCLCNTTRMLKKRGVGR